MATCVAYQGEAGAFGDEATHALVPGAATIGCATFDAAIDALHDGRADAALLPVENSISGPVPRAYELLWNDPRLTITAERVHRVVQHAIGLPGAGLSLLREIRSHPVALEQCRRFLGAHPAIAVTVASDTAGAVREIVEQGDAYVGAIASALAAERYGAKILAAAIQDVPDNFTRFFLVERNAAPIDGASRACVALSLANRPGALYEALGSLAARDLDLRTIVSRPSLDEPFTYRFYCEIAAVSRADLDATLAHRRSDADPRALLSRKRFEETGGREFRRKS